MQLVLDTKGLTLAKKNSIFHVFNDKNERVISPGKLTSIAITANVHIDASAIILAVKHEIPIVFLDNIGRPKAMLWSPYFSSISTLRRMQVQFEETPDATSWMIDLFELKTHGQIENLQLLQKRTSGLGLSIKKTIGLIRTNSSQLNSFREQLLRTSQQQIMGAEGALARLYWSELGKSLPRTFRFKGRSRRPAKDHFNAALNYVYGMLYSVVERGVFAAGLDPYLGLLHSDEYKKPTLVFDLIEPFRPWVDRLLIESCFSNQLKKSFFTRNQYGIFLNKEGKAFIIPLFNDFLRTKKAYLGQESTIQNHIFFLASKLAQRIRTTMS